MTETQTAEPKRIAITLAPDAAEATRKMASEMGCSSAEVIRRGLSLLDLVLHLPKDEALAIHHASTGQVDRLRFIWSRS